MKIFTPILGPNYLVGVDALRLSQQFFSHVSAISCLPGLNQYHTGKGIHHFASIYAYCLITF